MSTTNCTCARAHMRPRSVVLESRFSQTKFPAPVFEEEEDEENQPGTTAEEPVLPTSGDTGQAFNIRKPPPLLIEDDCERLEQLGLGIAVDVTEQHSWVKKSTFQAKPITSTKELLAINECNQSKEYQEVVEKFFDVHGELQSNFKPSTAVSLSIAADFHRSYRSSKAMSGKTVLTRTVAFKAKDPIAMQANIERFEIQLNKWLVQKKCLRQVSKADPKLRITEASECVCEDNEGVLWYYAPETNHECIDYLKALGSVTHYVSSVTLGASSYTVNTVKSDTKSGSYSDGFSGASYLSSSSKSSVSKGIFKFKKNKETIGKLPDKNQFLTYRGDEEAVVRCSYSPLSNLVSHPHLQKELESAIEEYIDSQVHGTRGPYFIATPGKTLYWKIEISRDESSSPMHFITCTRDKSEACNFYLKPRGKYFVIATDPEDRRPYEAIDSCDDMSKVPRRYIKANTSGLTAELVIDDTDWFFFKLKSPEDCLTQPLPRSRWLPESACGSQPYFVQMKGSSRKMKKLIYIQHDKAQGKDTIDFCVRYRNIIGNDPTTTDQLFILQPGRKT